ncbi:MAG: nuclear transport factor 2 family protein [Deltaproteobacteria bacterium]|nr:nuclear transport factor 2 family protein [Deltaproteobacteria bacterium]MBW2447253.1 nuclear transport factor 2 family protein [Deltaproteobacteria bacterium]
MDLEALEAIKRVKYQYMRCLDQKRWDEIRGCFTEDATAAYSGGKYSYEGRDAIVGFLEKSMGAESFLSCHRVSHPEIDVDGDTATGTWALEDTVIEEAWGITIRGAAFYEDRYVKTDDGWKIQHTGYLRTYEEIQPRANVEGLKLTAHWWKTGGQSELDAG